MPLYDFACPVCGPFEARRPMAEAGNAAACPACGAAAARRYSSPGGRTLSAAVSDAHERNERSRHEPQRISRAERDRAGGAHAAAHGHRHGPSRPWQLGH